MRNLITILSIALVTNLYPQSPDVFISERMSGETNFGRSVGHNDEFYFALRIENEDGGRRAYIDSRSKADLSLAHSIPVNVPLENAESFSIEELVFGDKDLLIFYSFFSKKDDQRTLAVSSLDGATGAVGGAHKVHSEPGKHESRTGKYLIEHHVGSGKTTVLITHPPEGRIAADYGYLSPEFEVIQLGTDLQVDHQGRGEMSDKPFNAVNSLFVSKSGDVYFLLELKHKVASYDHSSGTTSRAEIPELTKEELKIYGDHSYPYFSEAPNGNVYLFKPSGLTKLGGSTNIAGMQVISFDPSNCAFTGAKFFPMQTRDIFTKGDTKNKFPPALFHISGAATWWNTKNELMLGMTHQRLEGYTTYVEHTVITSFDPEIGWGPVYFHELPQTLSMTQTEIGSTIFVPDGDQAYLMTMDYIGNAGSDPKPRRLMPKEMDAEGLVPMVVHFDGSGFGPREPAMESPTRPPYRAKPWMMDKVEHESILILHIKDEKRLMRITAP